MRLMLRPSTWTHIPAKVNDFVGVDDDGAVLFAAMMHGADRKVAPWILDYRSSNQRVPCPYNFHSRKLKAVATACPWQVNTGVLWTPDGDMTFVGLSEPQFRQSTCLAKAVNGSRQRNNEEIRTIVNVLPLTERPHYAVTRGLFDTPFLI
jgi:hypothetical protein